MRRPPGPWTFGLAVSDPKRARLLLSTRRNSQERKIAMTQSRNGWTTEVQQPPHPVVALRDDLTQAFAAAGRSLRQAAGTVNELADVAASSLRVLDEVAADAFYAHQDDRREFYLESASEHLGRLHNRSGMMTELGDELTRHLCEASEAIERAGSELSSDVDDRDNQVGALRTQIDVLGHVVALARPFADQITRHALHVAESTKQTDALMLLDTQLHEADREVSRADEDVAMMRAVIESAQSRALTSVALAGSLSHGATHPSTLAPAPRNQTATGVGL